MTYQVIARKWRPQRFEDVVGQQAVTRTLQNAIQSERIAHAFLFSGVRGVGKTSTARILAKALNCKEGPTAQPCGTCISCKEITEANSVDVLEIDAASNTGVDNIRELRESVRYGTARDRFKIFIIDEVHMLSNAAFNALLKTLEEPPPHVKFILATTEHHKIPVTITSRCQQYEFRPIPFPLILDHLRVIARQEGIEISEFALRSIATSAEGSMRDAESALDQVIAFSGTTVSDDDVTVLLGIVDQSLADNVMESVGTGDRPSLIRKLDEVTRSGISAQNFCRKLIEHIRNLLVCKVAGWDERLLQVADSEKESLLKQAESFSEVDLIRFYDILNRTETELKWHPHPSLHLEMNLLKLIELAHLPRLEEIIERLETGAITASSPGTGGGQGSSGLSSHQDKSTPSSGKGTHELLESAAQFDDANQERQTVPVTPLEDSTNNGHAPNRITGVSLPPRDFVSELMTYLQSQSMGLFQHLSCASRIDVQGSKIVIFFDQKDAFHGSLIKEKDTFRKLSAACEKILGSTPEVRIEIEENDQEDTDLPDPTGDPRVQLFLEKFPGKVILNKNFED
ncbi:MAG TPA: DNA polymerase III subunit gamma/tau [Acidobacteriota bacterium]|nr:DNA polymerase III subunit gamma/tau [Acidobacteriota bacterium]